jgi:retron-type reverse transcriptase
MLRSFEARQCFVCGVAWHDPNNPVRLGTPSEPPVRTAPSAPAATGLNPVSASPTRTVSASAPSPAAPPTKPAEKPRGPKQLIGLELGAFAPLTSDEVRKQADQVGSLWGNPWFGRRDLIPPSGDKRTELIDRGMVGQGLITPEELEEIHRIGAQMDEIRPDLAMAGQIAAQAVARSEAEREAIKQQKKAEAAERERQRQAAIELRRRTDITFLGRGVSRGLADRRANVERLRELGLPVLSSAADVAKALGLDIAQLRWLAFHSEAATRAHYITFFVSKRSGGKRRLSAPHQRLRNCQEWILANVLEKAPLHAAAHGFVRGRCTRTNAQQHVGRDVVLNADLEDFFPTITFERVKGAFRSLGYSPAVATIFALLCTESPRRKVKYDGKTYHVAVGPRGLPQGACTSPALSNLVSRRLDRRLAGIAAKLGWTYTRYADDLTFSASGEPAGKVGYLMARVRHIAQDEGFSVNGKKTRVQRQNARQSVTGVVVNRRPGAPRQLVRRLRAILHRAGREGLAKQNREGLPHFESWLAGMVAYVNMLQPEQGRKLRSALAALRPNS